MSRGKIKICYVVSDTNAGGVGTVQRNMAAGLDRGEFEVIVVSFGSGPVAEKLSGLADRYYNLGTGSFPVVRRLKDGKVREDLFGWWKLFIWLVKSVAALRSFLKEEKVDILHSHIIHYNLVCGIAGRLCKVPSIWHIHQSQRRSFRRGGGLLVEGWLASVLASRFLAVSRYTAGTFHKSWEKKTAVLYNGIDVEKISEEQRDGFLGEKSEANPGEKLVGVLGLIEYRKGIDRFVEMAAKVKSKREGVKFVVVGGPINEMGEEYLDQLKSQARELGVGEDICFAGKIEGASSYLGDMDVFFMCSRPGAEALPTVVLEAMAAGAAVVGFSNFSMPEIIEEGKSGFLVDEGDVEAAAERVVRLLDDEKFAEYISREGYEKAKKDFDIAVWLGKLENTYREIIGEKNYTL